jgi:hypothetical protein
VFGYGALSLTADTRYAVNFLDELDFAASYAVLWNLGILPLTFQTWTGLEA